VLKGYRRLRAGASPEIEMGMYLTEVVRFANCAPLAGVVEHVGSDGKSRVLAMLQAYVTNQGDGWTYALEYLRRHLELHRTAPAGDDLPEGAHEAFLVMIRTLAMRTAELHAALATRTGNADFDPEPLTTADFEAYRRRAVDAARAAFALLDANLEQLADADADKAAQVLALRERLIARIEALPAETQGFKIRIHGDYHLGQVLITRNDFVIVDFEGAPGDSAAERRTKQSPLRDVAGMLHSFSAAERTGVRTAAHDEVEFTKLEPLAHAWAIEVRSAFLDAYAAAIANDGGTAAVSLDRDLLGLFELDQAFRDLRWELANRPAGAGIPLAAILAWWGVA
jgi:maltose alpha-D-glucosyltransferase/alpha-amylase